jgi:beta-aspartyl-peptidase (threonine type)
MQYKGQNLKDAATGVIEDLKQAGGMGGVIALDNKGNGELLNFQSLSCTQRNPKVAMPLNSTGMYRG